MSDDLSGDMLAPSWPNLVCPRSLTLDPSFNKIMCLESSNVVRLELGPLIQGEMRIAKLTGGYNVLVLGPRVLKC